MKYEFLVTMEGPGPDEPGEGERFWQWVREKIHHTVSGFARQGRFRVDFIPTAPEPYNSTRFDIQAAPLPGDLLRVTASSSIEKPETIHVDARGAQIVRHEEARPRWARCGQCNSRYEITWDDPTENHHRAMLHKARCPKAYYDTEAEHEQLVKEFEAQSHIIAMKARTRLGLPVFASDEEVRQASLKIAPWARRFKNPEPGSIKRSRRWWEFWRWFE